MLACHKDFHAVSKLSLGCHDLSDSVQNPIPHPFAAPGLPEALVHHGSRTHKLESPFGWMVSAPGLCVHTGVTSGVTHQSQPVRQQISF